MDTYREDNMPYYDAEIPRHLRTRRKMIGSPNRMLYIVIAVLLFGVFLTFINIFELRRLQGHHGSYGSAIVEGGGMADKIQPIVWINAKNIHSGYLDHVLAVFSRIGYMRGTESSDWDVLWSHDYPFSKLRDVIQNIKPHQRVNHFPGSGFITNKVSLALSPLKHIPRAFKMPADRDALLMYAKEHPDTMWVQKSNNHRGVKITKMQDLDLSADKTFIQQYVDHPFLIDGRRFDIGLYVVITSINPLRLYVHDSEWLLRFCPHDYYPFDPTDTDKYVIGDDYTPTWQMQSLKQMHTELSYSHKDTLMNYLKMNGRDGAKLQRMMYEGVLEVLLNKEEKLVESTNNYKSSLNFFEMVRFDYVLDDELNVYLMEVNMSPNLSSGHFKQNRLMYEQVMYSMLSLVGVARSTTISFSQSGEIGQDMHMADMDLQVYNEECATDKCKYNCEPLVCKLCHRCLTPANKVHLKYGAMEHFNRRNFRRLFPVPLSQAAVSEWHPIEDPGFNNLSDANKMVTLWFNGKCMKDAAWCS
ncbi:unnamed protein product [Owenia fusiformis]|uniref:Uncharacterized protein n=1 Tax=Owenia fusiformis TaxID=6347 RepID=A0A8S4PGP4_OWEFU|nr:unnamed protein product [Owenia fusiformis]